MKKVLLSGAALLAMTAGAAQAEGLDLDLGGHFKGYGIYNDDDLVDSREVLWRQETEIHFTGETTLDNGLTVGVHVETDVDGNTTADADGFEVDEAYAYFSGGWGRINAGREDGAAYLLQVAAPSADSNVDGVRQYISSWSGGALDYAQDTAEEANKATYLTPVFNGFQMGASYSFAVTDSAADTTPVQLDNNAGIDNGYELAARYEGAFEGVGIAFGGGYGDYDGEVAGTDLDEWNVGLDLDFAGFGLGAAYLETDNDALAEEIETIVVGADYQLGAYKLGASWLNQDNNAGVAGNDLDRYTGGASYSYGPGMSFRGSVSYIDADGGLNDSTQVLLGTQVNF